MAQAAHTVVIDETPAADLAVTSEGNVSIDHRNLLLNDNHAG
jgi:hypothetical protein